MSFREKLDVQNKKLLYSLAASYFNETKLQRISESYSVFREKVRALRPLLENLQNRVRSLIEAENDMPSRYEMKNALQQLRNRITQILNMPVDLCPNDERTSLNTLRGEICALLKQFENSYDKLLDDQEVNLFKFKHLS